MMLQALFYLFIYLFFFETFLSFFFFQQLPSDTLALVSGGEKDDTPEVEAAVREFLCVKAFLVSHILLWLLYFIECLLNLRNTQG